MPAKEFIGLNWGSTNFRAYRIGLDGTLLERRLLPLGVLKLDRSGMEQTLTHALDGWDVNGPCYAAGMIGSQVGWESVPYLNCPASAGELASGLQRVSIGGHEVALVPGLSCRRSDGTPDVMRGEEIEILGVLCRYVNEVFPKSMTIVLPGTHTKWARVEQGRIVEFFTAMSGELFDRLSEAGLLSSVLSGPGDFNASFSAGLARGRSGKLGLGTSIFSVRASLMHGDIQSGEDAASLLRGLLIGSEIGDACMLSCFDLGEPVKLVGNSQLTTLYTHALAEEGCQCVTIDADAAAAAGFAAIHRESGL